MELIVKVGLNGQTESKVAWVHCNIWWVSSADSYLESSGPFVQDVEIIITYKEKKKFFVPGLRLVL